MDVEARRAWAAIYGVKLSRSAAGWQSVIGKPWRFHRERPDLYDSGWWDHWEAWFYRPIGWRRSRIVCVTSHPYTTAEDHTETLDRIRDEFGCLIRTLLVLPTASRGEP